MRSCHLTLRGSSQKWLVSVLLTGCLIFTLTSFVLQPSLEQDSHNSIQGENHQESDFIKHKTLENYSILPNGNKNKNYFSTNVQFRKKNVTQAAYKNHRFIKYKEEIVVNFTNEIRINGENRYRNVIRDVKVDVEDKSKSSADEGGEFSELEIEAIEKEMKERGKKVEEICSKYGIGSRYETKGEVVRYPPSANYNVLYVDRSDSLTWCPVFKAASTSWMNIFCLLSGMKESALSRSTDQISDIARKIWPAIDFPEAAIIVPETTKFMIVRHPFERIVSAFRDKLENINIGLENGVLHFYEKYGKKIVKKYRKNGDMRNTSTVIMNPNLPKRQGVEPTFKEFVQYLIDTDLVLYADDHWIPYNLFCSNCYIDYDVIVKFETIERDQKYLIQKVKMGGKIKPEWKHLTKGKKTSEVVRKYISTLDKEQIIQLAEKYKIDMEMFGYTFQEYL